MNIKLLSLCFLFCLIACQKKEVNLKIEIDGKPLVSCEQATFKSLQDGSMDAGYRFDCKSPNWTLYVHYDTRKNKDGTIIKIELYVNKLVTNLEDLEKQNPLIKDAIKKNTSLNILLAFAANEPNGPICESAKALKRVIGEPPLETTSNGLLASLIYDIPIAEPCGMFRLKVDK